MSSLEEEYENLEKAAFVSFTTEANRQATHLRVVDPMTDPHVWAIIDDACNACCHSKHWRINAYRKFMALGVIPHKVSDKSTAYRGVAHAKTTGKW